MAQEVNGRALVRRISNVERWITPAREHRVVVRFEGPGSENFKQPTQEEMDRATNGVIIWFVAAKDGRPATAEEITRGDTSRGQVMIGG